MVDCQEAGLNVDFYDGLAVHCQSLLTLSDISHGVFYMTKKTSTPKRSKKKAKVVHPGMMGDGTEEQNLGERGNPTARIKKKEVVAAFGKKNATKTKRS